MISTMDFHDVDDSRAIESRTGFEDPCAGFGASVI